MAGGGAQQVHVSAVGLFRGLEEVYLPPGEIPPADALQRLVGDALLGPITEPVPDGWEQRYRDFLRPITVGGITIRAPWLSGEPGAGGALKTARKGVGEFRLTVQGRSAHAGINPAAGINAIGELARQVLRIEKLARARRGLRGARRVAHHRWGPGGRRRRDSTAPPA